MLFLLYINDLPNAPELLTFHLFADDTNIYCTYKNLIDLELKLNHELISCWVDENQPTGTQYCKNYFYSLSL